jgi:hypothetical protein
MSIKCISIDGDIEIPIGIATQSKYIEKKLENDRNKDVIDLPGVVGKGNLIRIANFLKHLYKEPFIKIERSLSSNNISEIIQSEWYCDFINGVYQGDKESEGGIETLFMLLSSAYLLEIEPLVFLCCLKIATLIKDKPIDEIRKTFHITTAVDQNSLKNIEWCENIL